VIALASVALRPCLAVRVPRAAAAPSRLAGAAVHAGGVLACAAAVALALAHPARAQVQMRIQMQVQTGQATPPAASAASASAGALSAAELRAWLGRIHDAAVHVNYVGTFVNSAGGSVMSSRVAHFCDARGNELERIDALDGEPHGVLRVNDEVRTLWPRYRAEVVSPVDPRASFPALVSGSESRIPEFYELQPQAVERVAGHDAERMLLKARDAERFDHLVWADRATGLLLRMDVQVNGRTLESSGFSDVQIGVRPDPGAIYAELHRADGYHVVKPLMEPTKLDAEGWTMQASAMPAGFQSLGCVRRTLPMPGSKEQAKVLQTIFSDGLTHVSLFIEPYQPQRHHNPGLTVIGATHTLTARRGTDYWITVVGDVPPATLDQFVRALDRKP
jgi:sigma-E factor negative regulatory protein RseB